MTRYTRRLRGEDLQIVLDGSNASLAVIDVERASVGGLNYYGRPVRLFGLPVGLGAGALDEATRVVAGTGEGSLVVGELHATVPLLQRRRSKRTSCRLGP